MMDIFSSIIRVPAMLIRSFFLTSVFLVSLLWGQSQPLKVNLVTGTVQYFTEEQQDNGWQDLEYGLELKQFTKIRTGENSKVELTDGDSVYRISPSSVVRAVQIVRTPEKNYTSFELITGYLRGLVKTPQSGVNAADIWTVDAIASIHGTDLVVGSGPAGSSLYVFKGNVDLWNRARTDYVSVPENRMSSVPPGGKPAMPSKIPMAIYMEYGVELPTEKITRIQPDVVVPPVTNKPQTNKPVVQEPVPVMQTQTQATQQPPVIKPNVTTNTQKQVAPPPATNQPEKKPSKPKEPLKPRFNLNANIGPINMNGTNYQQATLMPEFGIGKFSIGLYLPIFTLPTELFNPPSWHNHETDWNWSKPDGFSQAINKILYIGWGTREDPFHIKIGNINDFTIGSGFVMNRYSNMLTFPAVKSMGIDSGMNIKYGGFEFMAEDIFRFQIYGFRPFIKPLFFIKKPPLNELTIGYYHIIDTKPWLTDMDPSIHHWGLDASCPVIKSSFAAMNWYLNLGTFYLNYANGTITPYKGTAFTSGIKGNISLFLYRLELRYLPNGYPAEYFDNSYENNRNLKFFSVISGFSNAAAYASQFGILGLAGISFGKYGDFSLLYWANLNSPVDENNLHMELRLNKGVIKKVSGTLYFDKYNIANFKDLFENFFDYRTTLTFEGVYSVSPKVDLAFVVKRTFQKDASGNVKPFTSFSIETKFGFF
jgi:hypothetical protein